MAIGKHHREVQLDKPELVRPPAILYLIVKYLRDCIADQDRIQAGQSCYPYPAGESDGHRHSFAHVYGFIRDRMR